MHREDDAMQYVDMSCYFIIYLFILLLAYLTIHSFLHSLFFQSFNTSSSGVAEIGASGTVTKEISKKIVLLPIAPKFGTQEVNRFSQSPA